MALRWRRAAGSAESHGFCCLYAAQTALKLPDHWLKRHNVKSSDGELRKCLEDVWDMPTLDGSTVAERMGFLEGG